MNAWLPVALGICFIAIESTPAFGADHTSGPLRAIFQAIFGPVSDAQLGSDSSLYPEVRPLCWLWFAGTGLAASLVDDTAELGFSSRRLLALVGTAITASADEFHQSFLPNRTGTPWDVLMDCCGVLTLELLVYIFLRIFRPKKLARLA